MTSLISNLNPVPALPEYSGPHKVGAVDVEIPVSQLVSPSPAPEGAVDIDTVLFRIFFPAVPESRGKRVSWLPAPQRLHIAAYAQFLGAGPALASLLSFLPRHLHWTSIPAYKNATMLDPPADTPGSRWPTMVFSHGLGGNRNAYSHLAGSLASYGVVVVCPEHRDGSAALTLIRDPKSQSQKGARHVVPYVRIPHTQTHEVWEARNKQLRVRLWELGLVFEALSAVDRGDEAIVRSNLNHSTPESALAQFRGSLDILEPGRVIFAGHSFGAATTVQLLKSTFYADHPSLATAHRASLLFTPNNSSAIARQITAHTPAVLLDMWCFPLVSASTAPLYNLPMPCYSCPSAPGGAALLAIESAAFYNWTEHLHAKARLLSPDPTARVVAASMFGKPGSSDGDDDDKDKKNTRPRLPPHFFYVASSAHLNQSDFGVLFPWLTRRVFKSDAPPERVLRLNVRAVLQFLRGCGVAVSGTAARDLVDGGTSGGDNGDGGFAEAGHGWVDNDEVILDKAANREGESTGKGVDGWRWIDIVGLGGDASPSELEMAEMEHGTSDEEEEEAEQLKVEAAKAGEREMQGEMEPSLENGAAERAAAEAVRELTGA